MNLFIDKIKSTYDSQNYYDDWRDKSNYYKIITEITQKCIKENLIFVSNEKRVLDAGCGTGRNVSLLMNLGAKQVIGFDLSETLLKIAKAKFKKNKKVKLFQYNLEEKLPFENDYFDVIICNKTLPHIKNINEVIKEFNRVLKKGGIMVLDFYSPYSFRRLFANKKFLSYTRWDSISKVKKYLKNNNLKLINVYGQRTFMINEYLVNNFGLYSIFRWLEDQFSKTPFNRFSGYYSTVIRK